MNTNRTLIIWKDGLAQITGEQNMHRAEIGASLYATKEYLDAYKHVMDPNTYQQLDKRLEELSNICDNYVTEPEIDIPAENQLWQDIHATCDALEDKAEEYFQNALEEMANEAKQP